MTNEPDQPPSSILERKLVTILSADVAEYSRLMAEDEEQTLRIFREHSQTFKALVDLHHGRIFNTAGDSILAEFASPVEAVRCATDIQAALRTRNDQFPPARQVKFRIGVNLGDVMMQNSDLLGDGVNVAARLQGAAEPGGICVSGSVYDQIRNKLSLSFESHGERRFKNIPQPVRTFTIAGSEDHGALPAAKKPPNTSGILVKSTVVAMSLLVLAGGYWLYSASPPSRTGQSGAKAEPGGHGAAADLKPTVSPGHVAVNAKPVTHTLEMQSSALLADAQRLHRPQREIQALIDSNAKITALALQLRGLGTKPGEAANAASLIAQMKNLAADMSRSEATALGRASKLMWRDMDQPPGKSVARDAAAAIAAVTQAKAKLDDAIATAQQAQDEALSLGATRQVLAAYDTFATAYDAATQFYISARRGDFTVLATAAHGISDKLVAMGKVTKPFFLASRARKDAYQTLADNAAEAQKQVAQLDELEHGAVTANDLRKISAALAQASTIKVRLNGLLTNSDAAYGVYNQ